MRLPLYGRIVDTDAKFHQNNSARFLQDYEDCVYRVQYLCEQGKYLFFHLVVSELVSPFVQRFLSWAYTGIDCDVSNSDVLLALAKGRYEHFRRTRKMQGSLPITGGSNT